MRTKFGASDGTAWLGWLLALALLAGCGGDGAASDGIGTLVWEDAPREAVSPSAVARDAAGGVVGVDAVDGRVVERFSAADSSTLVFDRWRSALWGVEGQRIVDLDAGTTLTWASPDASLLALHDGLMAIDAQRWRWLATDGLLLDSGRLPAAFSLSSPDGRYLYALQRDAVGTSFFRMRALGSEVRQAQRLWRRSARANPTLAYPLSSRRAADDQAVLPATVLASSLPRHVAVDFVDGRGGVLASLSIPARRALLLDLVAVSTRRGWRAWLLVGGITSRLIAIDWGTEVRFDELELPTAMGAPARVLGERIAVASSERVLVALDAALVAVERDEHGAWQRDEGFAGEHLRSPVAILE